MKNTVKGRFEVKATPQPTDEAQQAIGCMRLNFEKKFEGPLEASGLVSMIGLLDHKLKSGAYVAIERITGALEGRQGSFCFYHCSEMNRGVPTQSIRVIPDSGTEELAGLSGSLMVDIVDNEHFYTFDYELKTNEVKS